MAIDGSPSGTIGRGDEKGPQPALIHGIDMAALDEALDVIYCQFGHAENGRDAGDLHDAATRLRRVLQRARTAAA